MSHAPCKSVSDTTIVAGHGLAQFSEDDLTVVEPSAASTAVQKMTRNDLLEKRFTDYVSKLESKVELASQAHNPQVGCNDPAPSPVVNQGLASRLPALTASQPNPQPSQAADLRSSARVPISDPSTIKGTRVNSDLNWKHTSNASNDNNAQSSFIPMSSTNEKQSSSKMVTSKCQPGSNRPIDFCGAGGARRSYDQDLESFTSALGEISPPKSFSQRLMEAKSKPRQLSVMPAADQQLNPDCKATSPEQLSNSSTHFRAVSENLASGELLWNSVLRSNAHHTSETWLLQSDSGLQHTPKHASSDTCPHEPSLTADNAEAGVWAAPPWLNYTATDVPWNCSDASPSSSQGDLQEAEQVAALLADEEFGELDLRQLEEDERLCDVADAGLATSPPSAHLTGLCEVDEITVRESWLGGGAEGVRRMPVDEYLQAGSLALGSLSGNCKRPSFGFVHSLPSSGSSTPHLACVPEASHGVGAVTDVAVPTDTAAATLPADTAVAAPADSASAPTAGSTIELTADTAAARVADAAAPNCAQSSVRERESVGAPWEPCGLGKHHSTAAERPLCEELVSGFLPAGDDVRSRGDGGSVSSSLGGSEGPGDPEPGGLAASLAFHSYVEGGKAALKKSLSVNCVAASEPQDKEPGVSHYGSLGRRGRSEVSRAAPAQCRTVAAVKSAISSLRDDASPNTARAVVLGAVAHVQTSSANATLQESVLDASIEIDLLRKRKEAIKSRLMKQSSFDSRHNGARKPMLQESRSFPSIGHSAGPRSAQCQAPEAQAQLSVRAQPPQAEKSIPCSEPESGATLDDTIRLEPCLPSATLQSTLSDVTQAEDHFELEATPALHSLTLCDDAFRGAGECLSEPVVVEGCVVGVTTWLSVPLHNPTSDPIVMVARVGSETLNERLVNASSLVYRQDRLRLQPGQSLVWALGICARAEGVLRCSLQLQLVHEASGRPLLTHVVPIVATAALLEVTVGDGRPLEVGYVPEGFSYEAQFEVHNRTGRELDVVLSVAQVFSVPVFRLVPPQYGRVTCPGEVACCLAQGTNTFTMAIAAPNLCSVGGQAKDSLRVSCELLVKLDTAELPRPMLASESVSVDVVAVHLHIARTCTPLTLQAAVDMHASAPLTLKNLSCIPLCLKLRCQFGEASSGSANLAVVPDRFTIQPNTLASPVVVFTPLGLVTQLCATVVIVVEPYGLEYEVPVEATSVLELPPAPEAPPAATAPNQEVPRSSAEASRAPAEVASMSPIEASKSRLVFGCVQLGSTAQQKLSLYNRNSSSVVLSVGLIGSPCFSLASPERAGNVVLPAAGIAALTIAFAPSTDEPHTGTLVCRPRGLQQHKVKYSIQLQGYGGCGELQLQDTVLQLPAGDRGCPAVARLVLSNPGARALCVAASACADVACSRGVAGVMVLPELLLLPPASCQDIVVVAPDASGAGEGALGGVLLQYTEEVLRRRHRRRLEAGCSKAQAAAKLSSVAWHAAVRGEGLHAGQEEGDLPSAPDDSKIFFSSLRQVKVPVLPSGPACSSDDASVTCFSPLAADHTLSDTTLPPPHRPNPVPPAAQGAAHTRADHCSAAAQPPHLRTEPRKPESDSPFFTAPNDLDKPSRPDSEERATDVDKPALVQEKQPKYFPNSPAGVRSKPLLGTNALKRCARLEKPSPPACAGQAGDSRQHDVLGARASKSDETGGRTCKAPSSHNESGDPERALGSEAARPPAPQEQLQEGVPQPLAERSARGDHQAAPRRPAKSQQNEAAAAARQQCDNMDENKENCLGTGNGVAATEAGGGVEVFPPELTVEAGAAAAVVVLNRTQLRRSVQVSSSHACLGVEPAWATLGPLSSASVRLALQRRLHHTAHALVTVTCDGHESVVRVTCLPEVPAAAAPHSKQSVAGLEVGQSLLSFPITSAGRQAHLKLSLKNLSSTTKQVLASVTSGGGSFVVKHPHFQVKVGHFVNVPVYFRPRYAGDHRGQLRIAVDGEGEHSVQLAGCCV